METELIDNGTAWTPDWLTWKERYEDLAKQNAGLVHYANAKIEDCKRAERAEIRLYHETIKLRTAFEAERFDKRCWMCGALIMLGNAFLFAAILLTNGGAQ